MYIEPNKWVPPGYVREAKPLDPLDTMAKILEAKTENDPINHPRHYKLGKIEVWDFIIDQGFDFLIGNVCKYICRAGFKGSELEDLKKARAYLDKKIKLLEGK